MNTIENFYSITIGFCCFGAIASRIVAHFIWPNRTHPETTPVTWTLICIMGIAGNGLGIGNAYYRNYHLFDSPITMEMVFGFAAVISFISLAMLYALFLGEKWKGYPAGLAILFAMKDETAWYTGRPTKLAEVAVRTFTGITSIVPKPDAGGRQPNEQEVQELTKRKGEKEYV